MHHANAFYGHAAVLARYCGLDDVPPIHGYLQHGWNLHHGFAVGHDFIPGVPKLVWSEAVRRRGWAMGLRDYCVIGSPWAYLLAQQADSPPEGVGTIVYPFHGWEGQQIVGDHAAYADEIRAVEGDVPLTMCLYWNDFEDPHIRKVYDDKGFRVISHGRRGHGNVGGDTDFLDRQLAELQRHRRVVSNRLGSALLYGAALGREIGVYGDPMVLENDHAVLGGMARQQRLFPQLHQEVVPPEVAKRTARVELGTDVLLPPERLREMLGWQVTPVPCRT
ncbi:hypothetical protein GCM10011492_32010 [Flexivirga endophytica]|uniref:Uncharacterized protein n=1 Tax=Flexivirga endophytica TaxID=1849103 RepID=A0A916WWW7_9MICO|nr:hypothetical protein [Flexivirga endophytica]GGB38837.1 hypothetical protein GCM10011492_32010 [Flexivirga endophytica]GHB46815.1 hypothetical protein GCM10008112_14400 [Flexivirga endophytica]